MDEWKPKPKTVALASYDWEWVVDWAKLNKWVYDGDGNKSSIEGV